MFEFFCFVLFFEFDRLRGDVIEPMDIINDNTIYCIGEEKVE